MIKSELIARIAARYPHLYQSDVDAIVGRILTEIGTALGQGRRVELRGFGAFSIKDRKARIGRNPRTGAAVAVAPKRIPHFKAGKELHTRLNPRLKKNLKTSLKSGKK